MKPMESYNSEFGLYDSIVNGRLRPFLPEYASESSIDKLIEKSNQIKKKIRIESPDSIFDELISKDFVELGYRDGDEIQIQIRKGEDEREIIISPVEVNEFDDLIDYDIPPPPDLKAKFFLELIEKEYKKIKSRANGLIESAANKDEISFYANKNIQIAKRIAADVQSPLTNRFFSLSITYKKWAQKGPLVSKAF
jgi:hypothetical protein